MKCPTDSATLVMSERNGIEIDYCPECRGVWLDRGELDKIIERAATGAAPTQQYQQAPRVQQAPQQQYRDSGYAAQQPYRKKKDNWLSELFD